MKIRPVKRYRMPHLPTRAFLDAHPELLRFIPKRWRKSAAVLTAVAAVCAIAIMARRAHAGVQVAPVFHHGDGAYTGAWGCIVVNPPVFLSEDEAQFIIRDEAKIAGIDFESTKESLPDISMPRTHPYGMISLQQASKGLELDGADTIRHISYEFVSEGDFNEWAVDPIISPELIYGSGGSSYYFRIRSAAVNLRRNLNRTARKGTYGIFYDPLAGDDSKSYSAALYKGTIFAPHKELTAIFPKLCAGDNVPYNGMPTENGDSNFDFHIYRLEREYRSPLIPLEVFCSEHGLQYHWDAANSNAEVTDPATGKTVLFSAGGPAESKELLREQVRDFITWLKAEGVI